MMAAAIPPAIAPKVGALLRMLGSDHDGEALGAARALGRVLRGAGLNVNDLAAIVERPAMVLQDADGPAPGQKPRRPRKAQPGNVELDPAQRRAVVLALVRAIGRGCLSSWETEFTTSILAQLRSSRGRLTKKQGDALGRLLHRLGEGSAWA